MISQSVSLTVYPNIHYLDIIAKLTSKGAQIEDLSVIKDYEIQKYTFKHSYQNIEVKFEEELHYNNNHELILWNTYIGNKLYNIFDATKLL